MLYQTPIQTFPNWDAGFYSFLSTALWIILFIVLAYVLRRQISRLLDGLVHRLFPSAIEGQLYDILIYLIPHSGHTKGNLDDVTQVDYYFGSAWGHHVFTSKDRGKRFATVVSAFGSGFLCLARVHLRNGNTFTATRYIDFESGALGSGS
jgi:hypothetical protein